MSETSTLLTAPTPIHIQEKMRRQDEMIERARIIVFGIWLEAYKAGDMTLEAMCRKARSALLRVPEGHRHRALGQMIDEAMKTEPAKKRGRGNKGQPEELRIMTRALVSIAHNEHGLTLCRGEGAFLHVADLLAELGVAVTDRQVEDWYYELADRKPPQ